MIVCICNNISEHQIQECIQEGHTLEEIKLRLHLAEYCGKCIPYSEHLININENDNSWKS
jgi:bacterioferritin-associated ferredoxin